MTSGKMCPKKSGTVCNRTVSLLSVFDIFVLCSIVVLVAYLTSADVMLLFLAVFI